MILLGFIWLVLLVIDLTRGLNPLLQHLTTTIWAVFILEFLLRLVIAPQKLRFFRRNWLTIIALIVPALRVFRIFRVLRLLRLARASRSLRLVRLVTSVNRGMSALGATLRRNQFGYVMGLSFLITCAGAAGMYAFERPLSTSGAFHSYPNSLWWTAMMMTTMGSDFWPQTPEGRVLCLLLAIYAFAVWGYVTATIATFFLGRHQQQKDSSHAAAASLEALRKEIAALRDQVRLLSEGRKGEDHHHPDRP